MDEVVLTLPRGKKRKVTTQVEIDEEISAPITQGDKLGVVKLIVDGEIVHETALLALETVEPAGFFARLWDVVLMWIAKLFS
jgi:D-alanyl-D-alanine carboxypeptidase (penicillin-binding protein 5/6)